MRRGYMKAVAVAAAMMLMLTGCGGNYPELTAEEEVKVAEYAAKLLLKYDANNRSRLLVREELEEEEIAEKENVTEEKEEVQQETPEESDTEAPVVESVTTPSMNMIASPEEFYELPDGISIDYQGMEICASYPAEGEADSYFALDATEGKSLLVMKFKIENQSGSEQHVDLLAQNVLFRITANGGYTRNALTTMLLDDMSTYVGDIPVGESKDVVLLVEVDNDVANNISTLLLNLKNELKTCTIQLK